VSLIGVRDYSQAVAPKRLSLKFQRAVNRPSWLRKIGHDVDRTDLDADPQQVSRHCGKAVASVVIAPVGNHHQDPARAMSMARNRAPNTVPSSSAIFP
jgi:hypothetical protein